MTCSYVDWHNGIMKRAVKQLTDKSVCQLFFDMLILAIDEIQADHTNQDACRFTGCQRLVVQKESDEQERDGKE